MHSMLLFKFLFPLYYIDRKRCDNSLSLFLYNIFNFKKVNLSEV